MNKRSLTAVVAVGILAGFVDRGFAQIMAGDMSMATSTKGILTVQTPRDPGFVRSAGLWVYDGKRKTVVNVLPVQAKQQGKSIQITYATRQPYTLQLGLEPQGRCIVWRVSCRNTGPEQLWLELGPEIQIKTSGKLTVFDGWDDVADPRHVLPPPDQVYPSGNLRFPVTVAWNERATVGVGIEPGELVSSFRHSYRPQGEHGGKLACYVRLVVDPGKEEAVRFVTCAAPGEWGKYEMFEAYYDSFPSYFVPYPGVDPRVNLGDSMQCAWPRVPGDPQEGCAQESSRRTFCGWSWCYAPFRRTGDILCRPELWEYKLLRPPTPIYAQSREKFLAWRSEGFAYVKKSGLADLFYVDAVWCEEGLAKDRYPDALITGPDAAVLHGATTGCDVERNVFPLNTSFGRQYEKDTRQIVKEINPSGFALDCAGNTWRYTGPVLPTLPARAWDDQVGVYCGSHIGVAKYMDFVHTLKRKDGSPVAMVPNVETGGPYGVFFRADATMLEGTPWSMERTHADRMRWKLGHKSLVWHCTYRLEETFDVSAIKTAEQLKTIYRGLADFTLLQSLRLGGIPTPWQTSGMAKLMRWLPAITECVLTGWQPVPAARTQEPIWTSRYGKGLKTLIVIAHETGKPVIGKIAVENSRIADGVLLFTHYDGAALTNGVAKKETLLTMTVPVRTPILIRAQLAIDFPGAVIKADVSENMGISRGTVKAVLYGKGRTQLHARVPDGMRVHAVNWNGKSVKFTSETGRAGFDIDNAGRGTLEVQYCSTLFDLTDKELLEYPFVLNKKPNCNLVVRKEATGVEKLMAYRVQEYFRYWYGCAVVPNVNVMLPIVESDSSVSGPVVNVRIASGLPAAKISRNGDNLTIQAPNEKQLDAAMLDLLRALDPKILDGRYVAFLSHQQKVGVEWNRFKIKESKGSSEMLLHRVLCILQKS